MLLGIDGNMRLLTSETMEASCLSIGAVPAGVPWAAGPSILAELSRVRPVVVPSHPLLSHVEVPSRCLLDSVGLLSRHLPDPDAVLSQPWLPNRTQSLARPLLTRDPLLTRSLLSRAPLLSQPGPSHLLSRPQLPSRPGPSHLLSLPCMLVWEAKRSWWWFSSQSSVELLGQLHFPPVLYLCNELWTKIIYFAIIPVDRQFSVVIIYVYSPVMVQ